MIKLLLLVVVGDLQKYSSVIYIFLIMTMALLNHTVIINLTLFTEGEKDIRFILVSAHCYCVGTVVRVM